MLARFGRRARRAATWWIGVCVVCSVCSGVAASGAMAIPGRGYELASPGASTDVMADSARSHAADGEAAGLPMAAEFSSLGGFGEVHGTGIATDYLAQRTGAPGTSGWAVHGITPAQEPLSLLAAVSNIDPAYELFSPDLTMGIFRAWSPLDSSPNVRAVSNLYLREDVRDPGAGSYQLLTDSVTPQAPPQPTFAQGGFRPWVAGASEDFRHVLFETRLNLTSDANGANSKLYKSNDGIVRLVRSSSGCAGQSAPDDAAPCSMAGLGAIAENYTPRVISADGSRANFASPFGDSPGVVRKLFQLDDQGTTATDDDAVVQVSMSEKSSPDEAQAATYDTASTDGNRVFFRSGEQLTETPGSGLYMWERQPANENQAVAVDATGGTFTLTAHTQPSQGTGTLTNGSTDVTDVTGSFTVGQTISGTGIDPGTTVMAVASSGTGITLSAPATADGSASLTASFAATTGPLQWDASAAQVQAALEGLNTLGSGNVIVTDGPGGSAPYTIEFTGALGGVDVMPLTSDAGGLTGRTQTATVTTSHDVHNLTLIGDGATGVMGASEDGHRIYFAIGNDIWYWQDADGTPGGTLSHVATLQGGEMDFNVVGPGRPWRYAKVLSRVTPDGRFLLFETADGANLPPRYQHGSCGGNASGAPNGLCSEAYVYRADSSTPSDPDIVCASCNLAVPGALGDTTLNVRTGTGASLTTSYLNRAITDDGRHVLFDTSEAIDPGDTNGAVDVYEYDVASGQIHLVSSGTDPAPSYFMDASADGHDVFFLTRAQLVGWDTDQAYDLYDARVGGGFPDPVPSADCSGDACQGRTPDSPGLATLGSSVFRGLGDLTPRLKRHGVSRRCRRGHVKRRVHGKVRCVKRRHARRHAQSVQRRADR